MAFREAYLEVNLFHEAIKALIKAIQKDSKNKQAYFYRASTYFENGNHDLALEDYLMSDRIEIAHASTWISKDFTKALYASLCQGAAERDNYFKNIKLELDEQNKHVVGKHNFRHGNSELEHSDPQNLLSKFAGKGKPINDKSPGTADYRERIDFGEFIGYYVNDENPGIKLLTTKGTIRYSKKGVHIVPSHPNGK